MPRCDCRRRGWLGVAVGKNVGVAVGKNVGVGVGVAVGVGEGLGEGVGVSDVTAIGWEF